LYDKIINKKTLEVIEGQGGEDEDGDDDDDDE
jgi:hypothetical protein